MSKKRYGNIRLPVSISKKFTCVHGSIQPDNGIGFNEVANKPGRYRIVGAAGLLTLDEVIYGVLNRVDIYIDCMYYKDLEIPIVNFTWIKALNAIRLVKSNNSISKIYGCLVNGRVALITWRNKEKYIPTLGEYNKAKDYLLSIGAVDNSIEVGIGAGISSLTPKGFKPIRGHKGYLIDRDGLVIDEDFNIIEPDKIYGQIPAYKLYGRMRMVGTLILLGHNALYHLENVVYHDKDNISYSTISF